MLLLALDGMVGRMDGALLFAGMLAYTLFAIVQGRKESQMVVAEYVDEFSAAPRTKLGYLINLLYVVIGLVLLVAGAHWLVDAAVNIARAFGVSELVIGLTIVSIGTSLPELATSVTASIKGERDIAVGNVVGSNLFNILSVLGLAALVAPNGVNVAPSALSFDIPIMIAVAIACLPIFFTGYSIARWDGFVFLTYYLLYLAFLVGSAAGYSRLASFSMGMLIFVVPLTLITLSVGLWRQWRASA